MRSLLRSEYFGEGTTTCQQKPEATGTREKPPTQGDNKQHFKSGTALGNVYRLKNIIIRDRGYGGRDEGKGKMNGRTVPPLATVNNAEL